MKIAAALALGNEKALDRSPMNQVVLGGIYAERRSGALAYLSKGTMIQRDADFVVSGARR